MYLTYELKTWIQFNILYIKYAILKMENLSEGRAKKVSKSLTFSFNDKEKKIKNLESKFLTE